MYDFYYTDWQLDSYKGVNDPCMNWSDSPFLVSTNLGTLHCKRISCNLPLYAHLTKKLISNFPGLISFCEKQANHLIKSIHTVQRTGSLVNALFKSKLVILHNIQLSKYV